MLQRIVYKPQDAPFDNGYRGIETNSYEQQICDAWDCCPCAVYAAAESWIAGAVWDAMIEARQSGRTVTIKVSKLKRVVQSLLVRGQKRAMSPVDTFAKIRRLMLSCGLRPDAAR